MSERSKKRFIKFHTPSRRIHRHFKGLDAEKEMLRILKENVSSQNLAREIASFYRNYLELCEDKSYTTSKFSIELDHCPVKLKIVVIRLKLRTHRTVEALTHTLMVSAYPRIKVIAYTKKEMEEEHLKVLEKERRLKEERRAEEKNK